jgi:hypothetical protein
MVGRSVVVAKKCSESDATVMCIGRYLATNDGTFWFDAERGGYCSSEIPARKAVDSFKSAYYGTEDHTGELYLLERCPSCSAPLPLAVVDK